MNEKKRGQIFEKIILRRVFLSKKYLKNFTRGKEIRISSIEDNSFVMIFFPQNTRKLQVWHPTFYC